MAVAKKTASAATVDTTAVKPSAQLGRPDIEAEADKLTPADEFEASGAVIEPEIVERVDMTHPAVDDNPRAGQPKVANQIDFNDPTKSDAETVAENLKR